MSQLFSEFQPLAAIATTPGAVQRLQSLGQIRAVTLWLPDHLTPVPGSQSYSGSLREHLATLWPDYKGFIFGLATGAVVRLIAPLLAHKSSDPAVIVVDEAGNYVISLCSGHQGRADQLTRLLALQLRATPVITGAAAAANLAGIDVLGQPFGWRRGLGDWTQVSAAVAQGKPVRVIQEAGSTLWQDNLPPAHPFVFEALDPRGTETAQALISISVQEHQPEALPMVQWHPRLLWVGIGCERGTSKGLIEGAIEQVFQTHQLAKAAIAGVASLDLKADEAGLLQLCQEQNWPLHCYPAAVLNTITVPTPSAVVAAEVGTPSVAEAAAIQAARECSGSVADPNATPHLRVTKQIFRSDQSGAVTIAVAQAAVEFTGRTGGLFLVGTGPGKLDQITPAAQTAISQADVVIGYSLYIDLLKPLLRPGQIIQPSIITQERQRAQRAIALAQWGLTVAVVSSGDSGIYGMAGLVLEELQAQGWDGQTPGVQVFPGVSALQAAAARVGAPMMHDFCAISLSNLLTPWPVIEQRLVAAAQADFVTALYNPRSQARQSQILKAQEIFLGHRSPTTPVAVVRSAYRAEEQIVLTTLDKLQEAAIDMLTIVLIGNHSTRQLSHWLITPRGYLGIN